MTASTYGVLRHFDDFLQRTNHWVTDTTAGYPKESTEKENEVKFLLLVVTILLLLLCLVILVITMLSKRVNRKRSTMVITITYLYVLFGYYHFIVILLYEGLNVGVT